MPMLQVYVDDITLLRLTAASKEKNERVEVLAEYAVSETALEWAKKNSREDLLGKQ